MSIEYRVEMRNFTDHRVEVLGPSEVADAGCTVGDSFDVDVGGQVDRHEQRVKFRQSSSKRVPDLYCVVSL